MKNKILLIVLSVLLCSCEKFLDEKNISNATADVLYNTKEGYETLINSCYTPARFWYGKTEGYSLSEVGTDLFTGGGGDPYPEFRKYDATLQANHKALEWIWGHFYKGINSCNAALDRIENAPLDEATKKAREGEARFLRAFYYWHLVETFGDIPLRTIESKTADTRVVRSSVDDVYKLIISDLMTATTKLEGKTVPAGGRVTKPAVEAFLSKVYLTRGNYKDAETLAEKVIGSYNFKLKSKYADLWDMANSDGSKNEEVVWFINYTSDLQLNMEIEGARGLRLWEGGHHGHMLFLPYIVYTDPGLVWGLDYGRPLGQYMPTLHLLDLFNEKIDARYNASFRTVWYANNAANLALGMKMGDTAAIATKYVIPADIKAKKNYKIYDRTTAYNTDGSPTTRDKFVQLSKFLDPTRAAAGVVESKRDAFVMRLAELYFIAAEAELMQSKQAEAAEHINVVRTRAALPDKVKEMQISAVDVTMDFILDERAREFAGEQLRWFDLKRTKKLVERVQKYNADAAAFIKSYHLVRPFPQSELDAATNKSELKQNDGYN